MSRYVLTAEHGYKIAVCMNGELCYPPRQAEADSADFGDTTDIEGKPFRNPSRPS
jgi:hypothetical protein